jgi:integrase
VRPIPEEQIEAVLPFLSRHVRAMVELQLVSGMRPCEVCRMRTADIDRTGDVWTYRPEHHKGAHLDIERVIDLGPRCRDALAPFLKPLNPTAYLFSPRETEAERLAALHEKRLRDGTPLNEGNRPGTNRQPKPRRTAGAVFTVNAYRRAIARACDKAFPPPAPLAKLKGETGKAWRARLTAEQRAELSAWRAANRWRPHRLRHNAATRLRREFGIDVARIILGHKSDSTTSIYAERDRQKARDVMGKVG